MDQRKAAEPAKAERLEGDPTGKNKKRRKIKTCDRQEAGDKEDRHKVKEAAEPERLVDTPPSDTSAPSSRSNAAGGGKERTASGDAAQRVNQKARQELAALPAPSPLQQTLREDSDEEVWFSERPVGLHYFGHRTPEPEVDIELPPAETTGAKSKGKENENRFPVPSPLGDAGGSVNGKERKGSRAYPGSSPLSSPAKALTHIPFPSPLATRSPGSDSDEEQDRERYRKQPVYIVVRLLLDIF